MSFSLYQGEGALSRGETNRKNLEAKAFPPAMSPQYSQLGKVQCQLGKGKYLKDQDSFLQSEQNGVNLELGSNK